MVPVRVVDRRWVADSDAVWAEDRLPGQVEAKDLGKAGGWEQEWAEIPGWAWSLEWGQALV